MSESIRELQKLLRLKRQRLKLVVRMGQLDRTIEVLEEELGIEDWNIPEEILSKLVDIQKKKRKSSLSRAEKLEVFSEITKKIEPEKKILIPLQEIKHALLHDYGIETTTAPLRVFLGFENEVISNRQLELKGFDKRESFLLLSQEESGLTQARYKQILKKLGI